MNKTDYWYAATHRGQLKLKLKTFIITIKQQFYFNTQSEKEMPNCQQ